AQARDRRLLAAEIARGVFEQILLFVQRECHCVSLKPSTRLATTLRFTSVVPPSIELPLERSQPRVTASSSGAKPSPDQPNAREPAASTISSQRSILSVAPATLNIDAMWLTFAPALASSVARCTLNA